MTKVPAEVLKTACSCLRSSCGENSKAAKTSTCIAEPFYSIRQFMLTRSVRGQYKHRCKESCDETTSLWVYGGSGDRQRCVWFRPRSAGGPGSRGRQPERTADFYDKRQRRHR